MLCGRKEFNLTKTTARICENGICEFPEMLRQRRNSRFPKELRIVLDINR